MVVGVAVAAEVVVVRALLKLVGVVVFHEPVMLEARMNRWSQLWLLHEDL